MLAIQVVLDGKIVYRSRFTVCSVSKPAAQPEKQKLVFHFKGGHVFQGEYRTLPTQTIEGSIWQAGADPDALLLGVSFVTDRVLLNTIHIAKPGSTSVSKLDRRIVIRTYPLSHK